MFFKTNKENEDFNLISTHLKKEFSVYLRRSGKWKLPSLLMQNQKI